MQGQNREATCEPLGHTSYNKNGSWVQSGAVYQSVGLSQSTDACDLELIASLYHPQLLRPFYVCLNLVELRRRMMRDRIYALAGCPPVAGTATLLGPALIVVISPSHRLF